MPKAAPRPCTKAGCTKMAAKSGRCEDHQIKGWNHSKNRHDRGYGTAWYKLRAKILERDSHLCQECLRHGVYTKANQVDHIKPKSMSGTDDPDNLQSLCKPCHDKKTKSDMKFSTAYTHKSIKGGV